MLISRENKRLNQMSLQTTRISLPQGLNVQLNLNNKTGTIVDSINAEGQIWIPRTVTYDNQEFVITSIGKNAFVRDTKLKSIAFPENSQVKKIGEGAFAFSSLWHLYIPASVEALGDGFLSGAIQLVEIVVSPSNPFVTYLNKTFLICSGVLYYAARNNRELVIPAFVKKIARFAFDYHAKLQDVTFEPRSQLLCIGMNSFDHTSLEHIAIPESCVCLEKGCFFGANELARIEVIQPNKHISYIDGSYLICDGSLIFARRDIEHAVIPATVKIVEKFSFDHCFNLKTVTYSMNQGAVPLLTDIGPMAFSNCPNLEKAVFPVSLKIIDDFAFNRCSKLTALTIPKPHNTTPALEYIGHSAFCECSSLETIPPIPASVKEIGHFCFSGTKLKKVEFLGTNIHIGSRAFYQCPHLQSASFPNATDLKIDSEAFANGISNFKLSYLKGAKVSGEGLINDDDVAI